MPFLADELIRGLPKPVEGKRPPIVWDADSDGAPGTAVRGFGLKRTAGGARTFVYSYRNAEGVQRQIVVAHFPTTRTEAARAKARKLAEQVDLGGDPQAEKQERRAAKKAALTVSELAQRFLTEHVQSKRRASTLEGYTRLVTNHIVPALGTRPAAEVTTADLERLHRSVTATAGPYQANRAIEVCSAMLKKAIQWGARPDGPSPAKHVERNREHARRRYLTGDELPRLMAALDAYPDRASANVIWLCLATGARKGEIMRMRWGDLQLTEGKWTRRAADLKQGRDHDIPLSESVLRLLNELREAQLKGKRMLPEFVFESATSRSKHLVQIHRAWRRLRKAADLPDLRIHDLRHSFASFLVSGGASLPLVGALLGHKSHATSARYAHLHLDPMRVATEQIGALITAASRATPPTPPEPPLPANTSISQEIGVMTLAERRSLA
jgi:integrase